MECNRRMIYFSVYQDGIRQRTAGYAGLMCRGDQCELQIYYREGETRAGECQQVYPVYLFRDGSLIEGSGLSVTEGMAAGTLHTECNSFLSSGKSLDELEEIYIEGVPDGICGGRLDGGALMGGENKHNKAEEKDTERNVSANSLEEPAIALAEPGEKVCTEREQKPEKWTFAEFMEHLPELRIPSCGIRKQCCRITLTDLEHLPKEWEKLRDNQFLLHGYYEYHHLMLSRVFKQQGESYIFGVPGHWGYREQYMAENFGFSEFLPLEHGKCLKNSFGYWCIPLS